MISRRIEGRREMSSVRVCDDDSICVRMKAKANLIIIKYSTLEWRMDWINLECWRLILLHAPSYCVMTFFHNFIKITHMLLAHTRTLHENEHDWSVRKKFSSFNELRKCFSSSSCCLLAWLCENESKINWYKFSLFQQLQDMRRHVLKCLSIQFSL